MTAKQSPMQNGICRVIHPNHKPMSVKVLGIIMALFCLGLLATSPVFGIVMALGAGGLLAYQNGIEVNFRERTYRRITAFGPQAFGTWQPLPALTSVSVFRTQVVSRTYGRSNASITSRDEVIQVNLPPSATNASACWKRSTWKRPSPLPRRWRSNWTCACGMPPPRRASGWMCDRRALLADDGSGS